MRLSEIVKEVIQLAQARRDYWECELPKRHPDYPIIHLGEDSGPPPPQETQLRKLLMGLPEDTVHKLMLIMYVGRGDISPDTLSEQFDQLKKNSEGNEPAVSQMLGKAPLADYLREGMERLKHEKLDVDKLISRPTKMRK